MWERGASGSIAFLCLQLLLREEVISPGGIASLLTDNFSKMKLSNRDFLLDQRTQNAAHFISREIGEAVSL